MNSQPELNKEPCTVLGWSEKNLRWKVRMKNPPMSKLELKEKNLVLTKGVGKGMGTVAEQQVAEENELTFSSGKTVRIFGLNSQPELNDQYGIVEGWSTQNNRWKVRTCAPPIQKLEFRERNLEVVLTHEVQQIFGVEKRVKIFGMNSQPELNDKT